MHSEHMNGKQKQILQGRTKNASNDAVSGNCYQEKPSPEIWLLLNIFKINLPFRMNPWYYASWFKHMKMQLKPKQHSLTTNGPRVKWKSWKQQDRLAQFENYLMRLKNWVSWIYSERTPAADVIFKFLEKGREQKKYLKETKEFL